MLRLIAVNLNSRDCQNEFKTGAKREDQLLTLPHELLSEEN
jgi:hypothetical protein